MTVGVLVITHDEVGRALVHAATSMLGMCPLNLEIIAVHRNDDPDRLKTLARRHIMELDDGDGVLILTDMYGATPSNIASSLLSAPNVRAIAGLNLPMLVRILNYPRLKLDELVRKAVEGGREGALTWRTPGDA